MIPYRKMGWGLYLIFRLYGSAVVRTTFFGLLAALETILLYVFLSPEHLKGFFATGVPYLTFPAFAAIVAFLVTFRQTFSYNRYHEGRTNVQTMSASMFTAFAYALSFDNQPSILEAQHKKEKSTTTTTENEESKLKPQNNTKNSGLNNNHNNSNNAAATAATTKDNINKAEQFSRDQFRYNMVHAMSLMHALCLQHLRCDWELSNLCKHNEDLLPAWDSASTAGFTVHFYHSFIPRNRVKSRKEFYKASKIQVIGGLTQQERRVLGTIPVRTATLTSRQSVDVENFTKRLQNRSGKSFSKTTTQKRSFSSLWTSDTACYMRGATERPYKLIFSTLELIRSRFEHGGINMPAPILASMWQALNRSIESFEQCRYLSDTPFPFQWAQLIIIVLLVWQAIIPLTVVVSYDDKALGVVMAMAATWILWALNEVARDIEDPFTQEPNDLPLARLQYQFNERLLAVAASHDGHGDNDLGWGTYRSPGATTTAMGSGFEGGEEEEERELPEYKGGLEATASEGLAEGV